MKLSERYKQDGIWTMDTPRNSCALAEKPLIISSKEERVLNELSIAAWRALETTIEWAAQGSGPTGKSIADLAARFPEGPTMPPAMRIDLIRTGEGPRIVEIDPITAISLGETVSLMRIWEEQGYQIPGGLIEAIATQVGRQSPELTITIPEAKRAYRRELGFLATQLEEQGIEVRVAQGGSKRGEVELSAFNDVPGIRRSINGKGWPSSTNPLWGPMIGLSDKTNLDTLISADKLVLPSFLPRSYTRSELSDIDPMTKVVAKPMRGTGSMGIQTVRAGDMQSVPQNYVFQEELNPIDDDFGSVISRNGVERDVQWVSRVSIYAGRYGLIGAQVTARPREEGGFTNVHGQADAVQTTIAVSDIEDGVNK